MPDNLNKGVVAKMKLENEVRKCCFIGHRIVEDKPFVISHLESKIRFLIEQYQVNTFLFGSRSEFNDICHQIVTKFKFEFPFIQRVLYACKSECACLESERENLSNLITELWNKEIHLNGYEKEYKFSTYLTAGRASYIERNKALINDSDYCIFYFNNNYVLPNNRKSGTQIAYDYAKKIAISKNKIIINIFE